MKLFCFIVVCFFLEWGAYAQPYETNPDFNRTRNWHFGDGVGLRFDLDTIQMVHSSIQTHEAAAVHTDQDGNLLLYSNGEKIWNANHEVIHNGNLSLGHHSSNSGSVFVFHEDNPDSVYLFNTYYNISSTKELSVNLIVREADTFRVAYKDSVLMYNVCEAIAVVKADNGKDVWVVVHGFGANNIYSYLLTAQGVITCPTISKSFSTPIGSPQAAFSDMIISSNGKYMVRVNTNQTFPIYKRVEVYSFNSNKGKFNFLFTIDSLAQIISGIRFNKDNSYLFITERDGDLNLFKFNPNDSLSTVNSVKKIPLTGLKTKMQIMPYEYGVALIRIDPLNYVDFIIQIIESDSFNVLEKKININYSFGFVPPNFNQSFFNSPSINFTVKLNCVHNTIQFYGQDTFNANNHNWEISKQGSSIMTTNIKNPLTTFVDTGIYHVRYIASNGSRSDTIFKEITILPKIDKNFLGNDTNWCENETESITLNAPIDMHCYEWSTGENSSSISVNSSGTYWVKITTPNFCVIYDTINVLKLNSPSSKFLGNDTAWCESENNSLTLIAPLDMTTYLWQDGSNTSSFNANASGKYYVKITNSNGCNSSDTIKVLIDTMPSIQNNFLGDNIEWCENIDTLFSLSTPIGNYLYEWNTGSNTHEILTDSSGIYFVKVSTMDGFCSLSDSIELINNPQPEKPIIYRATDTLKTESLANKYIWIRNGEIVGTNQSFLKLLDTGTYALTVKNEFNCENSSENLHIQQLKTLNLVENPFNLTPNPFNNKIEVKKSNEISQIIIVNSLGETVHITNNNPTSFIETSHLANGLYIVIITDINQNQFIHKLIKQSP